MLKEGEVLLPRWSSAMMQQLVGDGPIPRGEALQPIPAVVRQARRIRRYNETRLPELARPGAGQRPARSAAPEVSIRNSPG